MEGMVGITSQAQSDVPISANPQLPSMQQQTSKPPLSNSSQPTSPYATQLLGENLENSLSSIGGGVELSRTAAGGTINTGSVNYAWNKKSSANSVECGGGAGIVSSRSNGTLTDTQTRLTQSSNRSSKTSNSPILPGTTNKVKHPTSFKNLLTGFNTNNVSNKQKAPSALSPKVNVQMSNISREEPVLNTNSKTFVIDDDDNQSQPSTTAVVQTQTSSPRTHKSTKRKERDLPVVFIEHSNSLMPFENTSDESKRKPQVAKNTSSSQVVAPTIDLPDSNSSSTFANALCDTTGNVDALGSAKEITKIRKDKQKHSAAERIEQATESEHFQPNIDESSRIAFPISGIQEYLSLSNSSMSIFPSQQTAGSGETDRYAPKVGSNKDNQYLNSSGEKNKEVVDGGLTFAGKFKQNSNSFGIEGGPSGNYFSNGKETLSSTATEFPCSNMKMVENNCRDSLSAGGTASTSNFLPFCRNSNDSTSNSRASQIDLIDVVNQDSQSMITVDDLHQQEKSSILKSKTNRDIDSALDSQPAKYSKETSSKSKQLKEQSKPAVVQRPINASSKSSTPTPVLAANTVTPHASEQKIPKKRGRKKGSKGVDSVLAQMSGLSSQFLVSPALGSSKKVKTTMELLADIQNRKLGSATSSPTLMNWLGTSRPASSCSEPSLHSPRTSDACSTNATISTAARSTPEKNILNNSVGVDEVYESDSDSSTSGPSHDSIKVSMGSKDSISKSSEAEGAVVLAAAGSTSTIETQIKSLMTQLPPVNVNSIDWEAYEDVPCTCTLREIPPEAVIKIPKTTVTENRLELLNNAESHKSKDKNRQDDDEPIISVDVLPPAQLQQQQASLAKPWSAATATALHSLSAPASTVTSPVVPSTNQKLKSIFDLDFDDDNDPLHSFVEAAAKTQNLKNPPLAVENGKIKNNEKQKNTLNNNHSLVTKPESEHTQQSSSIESASYQYPPGSLEAGNSMMQPLLSFPTYEVVEDPDCQAKQRYDVQTNQITQFHINAFHNCFIPNVNGNWDHSLPQKLGDPDQHMEDNLYANVVPKYGCFVKERIPKDLSHVKFTKNFKPKYINKSDKPPPPFLGVANIHRRQNFRLHPRHNPRRSHKRTLGQRKRRTKVVPPKLEADQKTKIEVKQEKVFDDQRGKESEEKAVNALSYIPENNKSVPIVIKSNVKKIDDAAKPRLSPVNVPEASQVTTRDYCEKSYPEQRRMSTDYNVPDLDFFSVIDDMDVSKCEARTDPDADDALIDEKSDFTDAKTPIPNGSVHHLMNNNTILHGSVEAMEDEVTGNVKASLQSNNHELLIDSKDSELGASRRSSSCSNSSLKQNQNSINMKLRRHRLAQREAEMQKRHRKRKSISFNDVFDFGVEGDDQAKNPPLIKKIKIVNGEFSGRRRMTNSITDSSCMEEDGDSDCYPFHSENDVITEEEVDEEGDERTPHEMDEEGDEEVVDDYEEEDGDDEEEPEEDYDDFREVVTRDMTSSTTGNNHIVLTIKKTPSKTNSPSSSSMSPAPVVNANVKHLSISPNIRTVDSVLLGENSVDVFGKTGDQHETEKLGATAKLMDLDAVKTEELIKDSKLFLPKESRPLAVYNFELKKNGDNEQENSTNEDNDEAGRSYDNEAPEEVAAKLTTLEATEGTEKCKKKYHTSKVSQINSNDLKIITKAKLSESIFSTRRELRRSELKERLKEGIEEAQKLHRQLFFPYELHTSIGSKILEINSCTSDCTDPSDDETAVTDSNASSTSTNDEDALFRVQKRKRIKLPAKTRKIASGGGSDPSSSSSSSHSSDSNSSSSSYSAFTSWTSSDNEDDETALKDKKEKRNGEKKPSANLDDTDSDKELTLENDEENSPVNVNEAESDKELPLENNYLLRSFNHIYVSTEERRRQQELKEAAEYRRREIMNAGYITITGDDSKEDTSAGLISSLPSSNNSDVYTNYSNTNYNVNSNANNSNGIASKTPKRSVINDSNLSTPIESLTPVAGTASESLNLELVKSRDQKSSQMIEFLIVQSSDGTQQPKEEPNSESNQFYPDCQSRTNEVADIKTEVCSETGNDVMVPQEEYRTGLRQVDEDVDDEDGNNCARTQQFKEWHEVLQLRSYNDELLTVLPYVVIE